MDGAQGCTWVTDNGIPNPDVRLHTPNEPLIKHSNAEYASLQPQDALIFHLHGDDGHDSTPTAIQTTALAHHPDSSIRNTFLFSNQKMLPATSCKGSPKFRCYAERRTICTKERCKAMNAMENDGAAPCILCDRISRSYFGTNRATCHPWLSMN